MRNRLHRYRYNVVLLLATWLVACSKVPDDILSEKKMQAVQAVSYTHLTLPTIA